MKKTISFLLIFLLIIFSISSCSKQEECSILETGPYDCFLEANHNFEYSESIQTNKKLKVFKTKQFDFGNQSVEGKYSHTKAFNGYREIDYYEGTWNNAELSFGFNPQTKRCDSYFMSDLNYLQNNSLPELNRDECLSIAQNYFNDFISDPQAYSLTEEKFLELPEYKAVYNFTFTRKVNDLLTEDNAHIGVTVFGTVFSHSFSCLEELKNAKAPEEEDMARIQDQVDAKLDTIYSHLEEQYTIEYSTKEMVLSKVENEKLVLKLYIEAKLSPKDNPDYYFYDGTHLIVYLE